MEVIRQFVDASRLMSIMNLPEAFKNRKLEVIVLPTEERDTEFKSADVSGIVSSLVGVIPPTELSLSDLRAERLKQYETSD